MPCEERTRPINRRTFANNSENCSLTSFQYKLESRMSKESFNSHRRCFTGERTRGHSRLRSFSRAQRRWCSEWGMPRDEDRVRGVNFDTCVTCSPKDAPSTSSLARQKKAYDHRAQHHRYVGAVGRLKAILYPHNQYTCEEK